MAKTYSPPYPDRSLGQILAGLPRLREILGNRRAASRDAITTALGLKVDTGSSRRRIPTLEYYGLIEKFGEGSVRATELGARLIRAEPGNPETLADVRAAALRPALFRGLYDSGIDASADPNAATEWLIRRGVSSPLTASRILETYLKTLVTAELPSKGADVDLDPASNLAEHNASMSVPVVFDRANGKRVHGQLTLPRDLRTDDLENLREALEWSIRVLVPTG